MFFPILPGFLLFVLATIVQFVCGWTFYKGSYGSLKEVMPGMDLLVALGTTAAYVYSALIFFFRLPYEHYFETSATIITLVLLGRALETLTRKKATSAIEALYQLQPKHALVKREGEWKEVLVDEVKRDELFQVRPGERVPLDGVVIEGKTEMDESMLTGESLPLFKEPGDKIYMATQNGTGALVAKALDSSQNSVFSHIKALMKEAEESRAPIQRTVDKVAGIFVPLVLLFSLFTFLVWWIGFHSAPAGLMNAVAVLIIACPCALGMATPIVLLVGTSKAAKEGILIKNVQALQTAEKLKCVAFDKTGTLTKGSFELIQVIPTSTESKEEVLRLGASLEAYSEHPLAKIISSKVQNKTDVKDFEAHPGLGVSGKVEGRKLYLGSERYMTSLHHKERYQAPGKTVLTLSDEKRVLGYFVLSDQLREGAKEALHVLSKMGIASVMLTGDRKESADLLAKESGIDEVYAEILPHEKVELIRGLKKEKGAVAMVGDGINDAPALAASDCGFSMGRGVDIALRASDITLMKNDLRGVSKAISLSKLTFKKVRQNLFFAFIYNIVALPVAAFGWLNPMIAGLAMAASSLTVVLNALWLSEEEIG